MSSLQPNSGGWAVAPTEFLRLGPIKTRGRRIACDSPYPLDPDAPEELPQLFRFFYAALLRARALFSSFVSSSATNGCWFSFFSDLNPDETSALKLQTCTASCIRLTQCERDYA